MLKKLRKFFKRKKKTKVIKLVVKDKENYISLWPMFSMATCPIGGTTESFLQFTKCRDALCQSFRNIVDNRRNYCRNIYQFYDRAHIQKKVVGNTKRTRLLVAEINPLSDMKKIKKSIKLKTENALNILNVIERTFGLKETLMKDTIPVDKNGVENTSMVCKYFLGDKIWQHTPYNLYVYTLLIRVVANADKKLKFKTFYDITEYFDKLYKENGKYSVDEEMTVRVLKIIHILLQKNDILTDGASMKEMWDRYILYSKHNTPRLNPVRLSSTGYGDGIKRLLDGTAGNRRYQAIFADICYAEGILFPISAY